MEKNDDNLNSQNEDINIDTLSTILTQGENYEKKPQKDNSDLIFDINIKSIDDLLQILAKEKYDFFVIEPLEDYVKIYFKKDGIIKEQKNIKFHTYSFLLQDIKKITNLNLAENNIEQKGTGLYNFKGDNLELLGKTVPSKYGETIFLKTRISTEKTENKKREGTKITPGQAFSFLGVILTIVLILGSIFISFIILNAKTQQDVAFFTNLGISLNDINNFLSKLTTVIFSVLMFILIIILIIFLFKALLTKKEFKKKKTSWIVLSIFMIIITIGTFTLWKNLDKSIKNLPNWQEMSYGKIQIFDNDLLNSEKYSKDNSFINDYNNIIGPINLKFDVKYLKEDESKKGFNIQKYIRDFGGGDKIETTSSDLIKKFDKKGITNIKLTLEGLDTRTNKIIQKPSSNIPSFNINYIIDIKESTLKNGGATYQFDASSLKDLGEVEWFMESKPDSPIYIGYIFKPSKIFTSKELIGMRTKNPNKKNDAMDKVFVVGGKEVVSIKADIDAIQNPSSDLLFKLKVKNITNEFGNGFVERFKWIIGKKEYIKIADLTNIEESSQVDIQFESYGKNEIKLILYDSNGESVEINKDIFIQQALKIENKISISDENGNILNDNFNELAGDYRISIGTPGKVFFDAKSIKTQNVLYKIDNIKWDVGIDGSYEGTENTFDYLFNNPGEYKISIEYTFVHRKDSNDKTTLKQMITVNAEEKESQLFLDMKMDSEYAPTKVEFDASRSKVKDDNIVKFVYDYGDGFTEERDSKNLAHRYLKSGNYTVKLKAITQNGKEYQISKPLVIKEKAMTVKITSSLKIAPVGQEISFFSTSSQGQSSGFNWDFGDGNTSSEANPAHSYNKKGTYRVKLTIDFTNNNTLTDFLDIEIID